LWGILPLDYVLIIAHFFVLVKRFFHRALKNFFDGGVLFTLLHLPLTIIIIPHSAQIARWDFAQKIARVIVHFASRPGGALGGS
jgi:hypothetical protein